MKNRSIGHLAVSSLALILSGCSGGGDGGSDSTSGTASLSLNVTDTPIDSALEVVVEFSGVTLKHDNGEKLEFTFDPPKSIDLLALQGASSQPLLEAVEVPEGRFNWIRLHVNAEFDGNMDSYITLLGGAQEELRVPSGSQSGLKLNRPFTVAAGSSDISLGVDAEYTIDFNLRKSVHRPNGQPGHFLKPSLRFVQNIETGSISGTIDTALLTGAGCDGDLTTGNGVYVYQGAGAVTGEIGSTDEPLTTAMVKLNNNSGDYEYELGFLNAGEYTVAFTCQADQDFDDGDMDDPDSNPIDGIGFGASANATVIAGEETNRDL